MHTTIDTDLSTLVGTRKPIRYGAKSSRILRALAISKEAEAAQTPRICKYPTCETPLTQYNPGPSCYVHSQLKYPRVRGYDKSSPTRSNQQKGQ